MIFLSLKLPTVNRSDFLWGGKTPPRVPLIGQKIIWEEPSCATFSSQLENFVIVLYA